MNPSKSAQELEREIASLRSRLEEAEAMIDAIRSNEVDAFLVGQDSDEQVLVLDGVDKPYRLLIERMQQGAVTVWLDGTIIYSNHRFAEMLEVTSASVMTSNLADYFILSDRSELLQMLKEATAADTEHELALQRPAGARIPVHVTVSPLLQGQAIFCVILTDLTQQRRHEAEREHLAQAQAARAAAESMAQILLEADRRKDEFLAMLAHELRTPLAPLRSGVEILNHISSQEEHVQKTRDMMRRQIENLVRLVDDLLDVSRVTHGKITLQTERSDLATIVSRALESARAQIEERRHSLDVRVPNEPMVVEADVVRLAQAIANLLSNAAKFTPEGGTIALSVEQHAGGRAIVRVRDNGIGVAPEMLPKLFDLFVQADPSAGRTEGGLGIGLTLAARIVEMHGGSLQASSGGIGRGSEFVLELPLAPREAPVVAPAAKVTSAPAKTRRILIVDDHRDAAESLAFLLRLHGHEVREEYEGMQAHSAALDFAPEVIFLDIGLPGMNGYEIAKRMREDSRLEHVQLVALSGYGSEEHRTQCRAAGFDGLLVKPVEISSLESVLALAPAAKESHDVSPERERALSPPLS
jgi:PAS domain S-box-containing protein